MLKNLAKISIFVFLTACSSACADKTSDKAEHADEAPKDAVATSLQALERENQLLQNLSRQYDVMIRDMASLKEVVVGQMVALPSDAAVASLLGSINRTAATAGVTVREWKRAGQKIYRRASGTVIQFSVEGSFGKLLTFTNSLESLDRIVMVSSVRIQRAPDKADKGLRSAEFELVGLSRGTNAEAARIPFHDLVDETLRHQFAQKDFWTDRTGNARRDPLQSTAPKPHTAKDLALPAGGCTESDTAESKDTMTVATLPRAADVAAVAASHPQYELAKRLGVENQRLRNRMENFDKLSSSLAEASDNGQMLAQLNRTKRTPTWMLFELSEILTPEVFPTTDEQGTRKLHNDPESQFREAWNPLSVSMDVLWESGCRFVFAGHAKSAADLTQLTLRLEASGYFSGVTSDFASDGQFTIAGRARY